MECNKLSIGLYKQWQTQSKARIQGPANVQLPLTNADHGLGRERMIHSQMYFYSDILLLIHLTMSPYVCLYIFSQNITVPLWLNQLSNKVLKKDTW